MSALHTDRGYGVTVKSQDPTHRHRVLEHYEDVGAHPKG